VLLEVQGSFCQSGYISLFPFQSSSFQILWSWTNTKRFSRLESRFKTV